MKSTLESITPFLTVLLTAITLVWTISSVVDYYLGKGQIYPFDLLVVFTLAVGIGVIKEDFLSGKWD